jgi:tellurite resistance protein TerB
MGFFDKLASAFKEGFADLEREFARVTSRPTFERVCQAAFLIARADGSFDPFEKAMLQKVIAAKLPHFKAAEIADAIVSAEAELAFTVEGGIAMLLANITKARGTDDAPLIMLVAVAIGAADGEFDDTEKGVARQIAAALGLDPAVYNL